MLKELYIFLCVNIILSACAVTKPEPTSTPIPTPAPSPTPEWERAGWTIAWHDEFNGPQLDLKNWTFDIGGGGWGNQEQEAYTNHPENVRVENGMLVIEARKEETSVSGYPYSSARIKTQGLHAWQYGRIEARIKLPSGRESGPPFGCLEQISARRAGLPVVKLILWNSSEKNQIISMPQFMLPVIRAGMGSGQVSPPLPIRSRMTSMCMRLSGRRMKSAGTLMDSNISRSHLRMSLTSGSLTIHSLSF